MSRFLVRPEDLQNNRFVLVGSEARHAARVLRVKPGDEIDLFDGRDASLRGRVRQVTEERVEGEIIGAGTEARPVAGPKLMLYQGLLKGPKWDWLIEKASEIGVTDLVPVLTARTIVKTEAHPEAKLERWRRIALAAAKQCGRTRPMTIQEPVPFEAALSAAPGDALRLMPWEKETRVRVHDLCHGLSVNTVCLFIGPEGGWDPREVSRAQAQGVLSVRLGPTLLRSETAGLVAATLVFNELGVY